MMHLREGGGVAVAMDGCALVAAYLFPLFEVEMSVATQMKTILLCYTHLTDSGGCPSLDCEAISTL